ncbi:winged helix-turn-helix domain-containing protein [Ferrimonas senticii]|uniref:winged helix-turn-helix domain-containing protein n=1 Tax=Ferrimonas senticii TaxID=394566 RepID=UPI0006878671|nr:winged helix-turn-helix domain-containing protein [Ferrimonas senticii]
MQTQKIYLLGGVYWDPITGILYSSFNRSFPNGIEVGKLTNKQQVLLKCLLSACPNPIRNELLASEVWQGRKMSPESLPQLINRTRCALADDDKSIIVNHPGEGYTLSFEEVDVKALIDSAPDEKIKFELSVSLLKQLLILALLVLTLANLYRLYHAYSSKKAYQEVLQAVPYPYIERGNKGEVKSLMVGDVVCDYDKEQAALTCGV